MAYLCLEANNSDVPLVSGGLRTDRPSIIDVKWLSLTAMPESCFSCLGFIDRALAKLGRTSAN